MSQLTDDILSQVDIVDTISRYVPLKRAGSNFTGNCPFHNEKTPSFMVSPTKQIFKCFGCGKGGNVLTFVEEIERIDFWDAVQQIAKDNHIDLGKYQIDKNKIAQQSDEKEKIKYMHKLAQTFFVEELKKNIHALSYLKEKRKLSDQIIHDFGIGYAPESHYSLLQYIKSKGFTDADLISASLAKKGTSQDAYAFFRNRITFPIYDTMQNVIGFSARVLNPEDKPKYLNSAEHKAFDKSSVLYGLNRVKNQVKKYNAIIVVEGQMDVIGLARLEFPIGVATSGTALTQQHIKLIKRYTDNVYLLFDNDQAGQMASIKALGIAYQNDIFPKKISLPPNSKDVDELANLEDGKVLFAECMETAVDGFVASFQQLLKTHSIASPVDKQKIQNIMFDLIAKINNVSIRDHYLHILADKLDITYEFLRGQYMQFAKNEGKFTLRQNAEKKQSKIYQPDRKMLFLALVQGDFIQTYVQTPDLRFPLLQLIENVKTQDPASQSQQDINSDLSSLQLRREKELEDKDESRQLQIIKQTIAKILQGHIQKILKNPQISHESKQSILKLKKVIET